MNPVKHSFYMARATDKLREISNFLASENMRVKYVRRGVIRVVKMEEFKILCKGSQWDQL
jgi:hypothetical protein